MLDLGWPELFVIVLVALVVLGPKELPGAIRTVTGLVRRARGLAREFHKSIDEMAKETGLDEVKRDIQKAAKAELDDDGLLGDPFAEADKNSILNPTNGSKLPKAQSAKAESKPAKAESKPAKAQPKPAKAGPKSNGGAATDVAAAKPATAGKPAAPVTAPEAETAEAKPEPAPEVAKENTRA